MNISIVIPAHNEEDCIETTVRGIVEHVRTPYELLVVADHCSDRTEEIVRTLMEQHEHIRLLSNQRDGSFSNALITGLKEAKGEAIVAVMADMCDDPTTIDRMWQTLQDRQADVVCASRYMRGGKKTGGPRLQNILSRLVSYTLKIFTRIPTWDVANSYKMYRHSFLDLLKYDIPNGGTEYSMALLFRAYFAGAKIVEIPTTWKGKHTPLHEEFRILKRFPGYWRWYQWAMRRKIKN